MGQTIVRARELQREDLFTAAALDHRAQQAQRTDDGARPPCQVMRTAMRTRCVATFGVLAERAGFAPKWRSTPRDHTARVLVR